jgi:tRNA pseudouridine55 synthase
LDGAIVVDKPEGWTSHDVVNKLRRIAQTKKIGHLGTLDPIATGVLPLVVGRATRLAQFFTRNDKVYDAIIRFGYATDSYDRSGAPASPDAQPEVSREELDDLLPRFTGEIQQAPPPVSAKKVAGVRAYKLARKHIEVELEPVTVRVYSLQLKEIKGSEARIVVHCSAGTYVRLRRAFEGFAAHRIRRFRRGERQDPGRVGSAGGRGQIIRGADPGCQPAAGISCRLRG